MSTTLSSESKLKNDDNGSIGVIGGLGSNSYFKHSFFQKMAVNVTKNVIEEALMEKLDVKSLLSTSTSIRIADLGCAVGPNTFTAVQEIIDVIKKKYQLQIPNSPTPEFQVFFNDQASNDFNTLFTSLPPERDYFPAGVPGSFYQRLFPENSLHIAHTFLSLHWMSRAPEGVEDENSPAWNKGKIHYASASDEVLKAYAMQWEKDFNMFLNARAKEIVYGGMLIVVMPSIPDGMPYSELANGMMCNCMASILYDMAKTGLISEEQVDAFNLPVYAAPPGEFTAVVEKNGHFKIESSGLVNPSPWLTEGVHVDMVEFVSHIRAAMEAMFLKHLPNQVVDEMFRRLEVKLSEISEQMVSAYKDKIQSYYILQRKRMICVEI